MLDFLKTIRQKRQIRKLCLAFDAEIKINLERYYVMFQLGKLRFFQLECWEKIKNSPPIALPEAVIRYGRTLEEYNGTLRGFKDFEQWYAADINRKTKENGLILHGKQAEAKQKFQGLEGVIKNAQTAFAGQFREGRW